MPTFRLGNCSVDLTFVPLTGALAPADRQFAWLLYLELVARPALREETPNAAELAELITRWRQLLATWPAAQLERPAPTQLGYVVLAAIEMVLLPALRLDSIEPPAWHAVRMFCHDFAGELARCYDFNDAAAELPADLQAAWQAQP